MKAFDITPTAKVYVYTKPLSMCCSFPRLKHIVNTELGLKPDNGDLFVFMNKKHTYLKILFFMKEGHCIFAKTLPRGKQFKLLRKNLADIKSLENLVNNVVLG